MSDLDDFQFDSNNASADFETGPVSPTDPANGEHPPAWRRPALIAVVVILVGAGAYWFLRPGTENAPPSEPTGSAPPAPAPEPTPAEPEPALELPALGASDSLVRELVGALSSRPGLAAWLASDELVRRFTAAVVNIAEGSSPRSHLGVLAPDEPFTASHSGDMQRPTNRSYARYDGVADVVAGLDVEGTVELYRQLEPLAEEAFLELGYPGEQFRRVLLAALDHLLATPSVEADVPLVESVASFRYADPELESLSAAQKHLLRMGPDNVRRVQETLRALRRALLAGSGGPA